MPAGVDTTFLVEVEVAGHAGHQAARRVLSRLLDAGESLAIAPQVLAEFIHVTTDGKRFSSPLSVPQAVERAESWWNAREVERVYPTADSTHLFFDWMRRHGLGRKRLLDTQLAATYAAHGVRTILTSNARDYAVFGWFEVIAY
jgi:predicted nucleic acid-binding protein